MGEEGKRQKDAAAGLGRGVGAGINQPGQGGVAEALGQFEAFRSGQIKVMAATAGGQREAGGAIPEKTEGMGSL